MKKKQILPVLLSSTLIAGSFAMTPVSAQPQDASAPVNVQAQKVWNEKANVPVFVKEKFAEKKESSNAANAVDYLEKNEAKTGIKNAKQNLKVKNVQEDDLGMTHIRFAQTKDNVPIEGSEVIVHFNKNNEVVGVNGHYNKIAEEQGIQTTASIDSESALEIAKASVHAPEQLSYEPVSETVVYPFEGENILAHKVNLTFLGDEPGNWFVFVDANTGAVIDKYNAVLHADELKTKDHKGVGQGVHGELRDLHTTLETKPGQGTSFKLYDESHENVEGIYTFDHNTGEIFENNSSSWKDEYHSPAVDAHYNSETVYDYYLEEHGRNSLDDNGMAIISYVHFGTDYNNAFWNGRHMTYGDGDGEFMVPLSAGLDVAAHEMTHGVISHTANLQYRNQSGALNESFADVFGALIDADDWEMGEDIMAPDAKADGRTALRSLSNPGKFEVSEERAPYGNGYYPEHMDEFYDMPISVDNGGVHVNSSITNHAAYLIGEQIGKEKLGQIYYRALTVYLTPTSDFSDARQAIVQSAVDIYGEGSEEVAAVESGFDQVGIY
ncbi:M4 family metallopeptidase [Oceanobacillus halophilus]|uniref:Neutral metalloproteinase n=1 Tax=Oceanobacillus halophilus TaxID=930130 RepID=A0A494ZR27_9BACI|nr:M4 family metallopeptidase [Oceanobacillus halophilus]RKQ28166.1 peptidase M4 family protein [Oceanobacillus halophilus]